MKRDGSELRELHQRDFVYPGDRPDINSSGDTVFSTLDQMMIVDAAGNEVATWSIDSRPSFSWAPTGDRIVFIDWIGLDDDVMVWTTARDGTDARLIMMVDRATGEIASRPEFLLDPRVVEYMGEHGYE